MLWTIILILLILWALGFGFASQSVGGFIHILLVVALVVFIVQLVRGRRAV
ncbi:MAG: lmo0937 family membrane protein [Pyrinomonadaceae bacterium]|nr:lmo0937 family membrane protein [Pyrinomonadaceae bacterium]